MLFAGQSYSQQKAADRWVLSAPHVLKFNRQINTHIYHPNSIKLQCIRTAGQMHKSHDKSADDSKTIR